MEKLVYGDKIFQRVGWSFRCHCEFDCLDLWTIKLAILCFLEVTFPCKEENCFYLVKFHSSWSRFHSEKNDRKIHNIHARTFMVSPPLWMTSSLRTQCRLFSFMMLRYVVSGNSPFSSSRDSGIMLRRFSVCGESGSSWRSGKRKKKEEEKLGFQLGQWNQVRDISTQSSLQ